MNPAIEAAAVGPQAGQGVIIDVIDTGLAPRWREHAWMANVEHAEGIIPDRLGASRFDVAAGEPIPLDYGHGTFIAGVLACLAPKATIRVANDFQLAGAVTEEMLQCALERTLNAQPKPHIISLSAGGTSESCSMMGLKGVVEKILDAGIVLVAAAGNNGNDTRFYPAAFDGVTSVGALRENLDGQACFSDYGDWVSVYAPGERLVNAFAYADYRVQHERRETCRFRGSDDDRWYAGCTCVTTQDHGDRVTFDGLARWSGTSFATPIVAGLIAARASSAGQSAAEAKEWLLRHPSGEIEGLGKVVLPGQSLECRDC